MSSQVFYRSIFLLYRFLSENMFGHIKRNAKLPKCTSLNCLATTNTAQQLLVFQLEGGILRSTTTFPYFMLVALEAGSFLRGLFLLLLYPLICCLSHEMGLSIMTMVAFCGVRVKGFRLGRAVLAKHFLEDIGFEPFDVLDKYKTRICFSGLPRVMVEGFLKEYLGVEVLLGREIRVLDGYFTGLMVGNEKMVEKVKKEVELHATQSEKHGVVGIGGLELYPTQHIFSSCKEVCLSSEVERRKWRPLPRSRYPKPLIFHDGRIALKPTVFNSLSLFLWFPLSVPLAITRATIFLILPYHLSLPLIAFLGIYIRTIIEKTPSKKHAVTTTNQTDYHTSPTGQQTDKDDCYKGQIYVCNHRTLLDPLYITSIIRRNLVATTYSVSPVAEILSPIKTIRMTRNKEVDREKMKALLKEGDIVVCPEGTTCREPYLLRFSPLFAELNHTIVPVALTSHVSMFHGTTASGKKHWDPLYFLMNPAPHYTLEFLDKVEASYGDNLGKQWSDYFEVANYVQGKIARALGFECTKLNRRDKYLMLADNEGIVEAFSKGS